MPSLYTYYPQTNKIHWRGYEWVVEFRDDKAVLTCPDVLSCMRNGMNYTYNQIAIPRDMFEDILKFNELKESLNFELGLYSI